MINWEALTFDPIQWEVEPWPPMPETPDWGPLPSKPWEPEQ